MRDIIISQIRNKNAGLVIAATCYLCVTSLIYFILVPVFLLLVDFRYNHPSGTGTILITTDQWMESVPQWSHGLYNLGGLLLVALAVWILINILHHTTYVIYTYWLADQKQKYPLSY